MNITLRPATPADAAQLTQIARRTFYDTFTGTCSESDMQVFLDTHFTEEVLRKELEDPSDNCYLAFVEDELAGYTRFKEDNETFPLMNQWRSLELKRIYVDKAFHGKGVANHLLQLIFDFAAEHQYEAIWLGVWESNLRAQAFYEKHGFAKSGHIHPFPIGETPQTDWWYWKFLQPVQP